MLIENIFNFRRPHIIAAGDDHVVFAVHEINIAVLIDGAHIAGIKPAVFKGILSRLRIAPVAVKDMIPLVDDFSDFTRFDIPALLVYDSKVRHVGRPTGRRQSLYFLRCSVRFMLPGEEHARGGRLTHAVVLGENGAEFFQRFFHQLHRHGSRTVIDRVHAAQVPPVNIRMVDQDVKQRGHQQGSGGPNIFNCLKYLGGI